MAWWETTVQHYQPEECAEPAAVRPVRVTQPARLALGGMAVLGRADVLSCRSCGRDLQVLAQELKDNGLRITRGD
jgi:hypothetical protein